MFTDKIINEIEFVLKSIRFEYVKRVAQPLKQRKYERQLEASLKEFDALREKGELFWATEQQLMFDALREKGEPFVPEYEGSEELDELFANCK